MLGAAGDKAEADMIISELPGRSRSGVVSSWLENIVSKMGNKYAKIPYSCVDGIVQVDIYIGIQIKYWDNKGMFCVDEILFQVDQLVVVYVCSCQILSMLEKLRLGSIQCKIGH